MVRRHGGRQRGGISSAQRSTTKRGHTGDDDDETYSPQELSHLACARGDPERAGGMHWCICAIPSPDGPQNVSSRLPGYRPCEPRRPRHRGDSLVQFSVPGRSGAAGGMFSGLSRGFDVGGGRLPCRAQRAVGAPDAKRILHACTSSAGADGGGADRYGTSTAVGACCLRTTGSPCRSFLFCRRGAPPLGPVEYPHRVTACQLGLVHRGIRAIKHCIHGIPLRIE